MAPRSSWKGYLKLSLVSIPVKGYNAVSGSTAIRLNQLHESCHSRIKYQKTCPIHGPVRADEIVSGYEYSKGQYVVVDTAELEKLRSDADKSITLDSVVDAGTIDPAYFSGRTYYLVPDGPIGQKPYALIQKSLAEQNVVAVGRVIISAHEQVVMVRPLERLLAMTVLNYETSVMQPSAVEHEVLEAEFDPAEVKLTRTLLEAFHKDELDLAEYRDLYTERLTALIEAKVEGREIVSPPPAEEAPVINLMDALRQSVAQAKVPKKGAGEAPLRKMAKSAPQKSAARRKRKSG